MIKMTSHERVLCAINHQEPDRVPLVIGGGPYGLVDDLYFRLRSHFELDDSVQPFRKGHSISYMDDRLLEKLGVDARYVWPGASPSSPAQETDDAETLLDGYGQTWKRAVPYYYADKGILSQASSVDEIDAIITWPDVDDPKWMVGVAERAKALHENTDYFVIARMVTSHGPFQTACDLRGTETFMMDMMLNEAFATHLVNRIADTLDGLLQQYLQACGDYIDMVELPGDDYASNLNLMISPKTFKQYFKPVIQRMVTTVKNYREDIKVMLHSDGMITPLLPEFIEVGIDVVHPLEPLNSMDFPAIKATYGDQITFLGSIDISHAMPGTKQQIIDEAKLRIRQLATGGGYILAPSNHLQADVPVENVIALFDTAREFGTYPMVKG